MRDRVNVEELLSTSDLQVLAGEITWKHVHAEYVDIVDDILATLAPSGPYAYTVSTSVEEGKEIPTQRIVTTYDDIAETYNFLHRFVAVIAIRPMTEIHASWYTFICGMGRGRHKGTGDESERPIVVLFPTMGSEGITGELFWGQTQKNTMGGDAADGPQAGRLAVARLHKQHIDAVRKGDIDTLVEMSHPEIQTAVRDYVAQTGTLTELHTKDDLKGHLQDFYARYTVLGLEIVNRCFEDWVFFHELRWTVEALQGPDAGSILRYHTAEYAEVSAAGLLVSHIGHGTDQIKLG